MPPPVNSGDSDVCPFIAPDESYLLFSSVDRNGGFGKADLFICYRRPDRTWTIPMNLGPSINSAQQDYCPLVTKDGKYMFFLSFRNGKCHPYWVDARVIDKLKAITPGSK